MKIVYARVSTLDQNMFLQLDGLERAGCDKIFTDTASGSVDMRKGLRDAIDFCRPGDSLILWKLDRLGRSLRHLIDTMNQLKAKGAPIHFLAVMRRHEHLGRKARFSFSARWRNSKEN
jgi:DNA invertase Pin-like site-specific DNA recombinase